METIQTKTAPGARKPIFLPDNLGYELYSNENKIIPAHSSTTVDTGVQLVFPTKTNVVGLVNLSTNCGVSSHAVINLFLDETIKITLINHTNSDFPIKKDDKIGELYIIKVLGIWPAEEG